MLGVDDGREEGAGEGAGEGVPRRGAQLTASYGNRLKCFHKIYMTLCRVRGGVGRGGAEGGAAEGRGPASLVRGSQPGQHTGPWSRVSPGAEAGQQSSSRQQLTVSTEGRAEITVTVDCSAAPPAPARTSPAWPRPPLPGELLLGLVWCGGGTLPHNTSHGATR